MPEYGNNARNRCGVKDAADCYRTIQGVHYTAWMSCPSADRIAAYRSAGLRVRRLGLELFVHIADVEKAADIDAAAEA